MNFAKFTAYKNQNIEELKKKVLIASSKRGITGMK